MPVSDVTSGLTAEYTFEDSLANRLQPDVAAKVVQGKLSYADGRTGRAANLEEEPQISFGDVGGFTTHPALHDCAVDQARRTVRYGCSSAL